ncbi:recombination mediator RecR [Bacteroidota bacterium]|nr:recombination mediator RecR [Bacteroidota bacterium]
MNFPSKLVEKAAENLSFLPGIGKKTALRLVLYLLRNEKKYSIGIGQSIIDLINNIKFCKKCNCISDEEICEICKDPKRNSHVICVVEDVRTIMAIESTMQFNGHYHVLGGLISPMDGIGPEKLKVQELLDKIDKNQVTEIIFALSSTMEGDTTNYYLFKKLNEFNIKISSIARGISVGNELEYIDELTLGTAITRRVPYENSVSN